LKSVEQVQVGRTHYSPCGAKPQRILIAALRILTGELQPLQQVTSSQAKSLKEFPLLFSVLASPSGRWSKKGKHRMHRKAAACCFLNSYCTFSQESMVHIVTYWLVAGIMEQEEIICS
jgi:hypothetical protein